MGRPESADIAAVDDISGMCVGIRGSVAVLIARLRGKLTDEDRAEIANIVQLTYDIQEYHEPFREQVSEAYQARIIHLKER